MPQRDFPGGIVGSLEGRVGRPGDGGRGSESLQCSALQMGQWTFQVEEKGVKRMDEEHGGDGGVTGREER